MPWAPGVPLDVRRRRQRPAGTGLATSVGMAIASHWQAATFNRPGFEMFDFDVYALCGDGDMMEGVSFSGIVTGTCTCRTCAGSTTTNRSPSKGARRWPFPRMSPPGSSAWAGTSPVSATPTTSPCCRAYATFRNEQHRPTLIIVDSSIAHGARTSRTPEAHGEPLGEDEVRATKRFYGWPEDAQFRVPDEVYEHFADEWAHVVASCATRG